MVARTAWRSCLALLFITALGVIRESAFALSYGNTTIDGNLSEWSSTDRLDLPPWAAAGTAVYNRFQADTYLLAISSSQLSSGSTVTIWLNTDRNTATGYKIWGLTTRVEQRVDVTLGAAPAATLYTYTNYASGTAAAVANLPISAGTNALELAIPRTQLAGMPSAINMLFMFNSGALYLPADFSRYQYTAAAATRPVRTDLSKHIGIVYSPTTAAKYFDLKAYSQLFMAAQNQAMMAGIPFDLLSESQLLDVRNVLNYDALVFPLFSHVQSAQRAVIEGVLHEAVYRYKVGMIAAGDFITNDAAGAALPTPYQATNNLFGLSPVSSSSASALTLKTAATAHPVIKDYAGNTAILQYGPVYYKVFGPLAGLTSAAVVNQQVGASIYPAIISTVTGGRNVHFATDQFLGDTDILWPSLRWVVYGADTPVALQMGRQKAIFVSRNDGDQSMYIDDFPLVYPPLQTLLDQWKNSYNFVGSYYLNIGANPAAGIYTNWAVAAPIYKNMISRGNEIGTHSYTHPDNTNLLTDAQIAYEFRQSKLDLGQQIARTIVGAAVPGNPESLATDQRIESLSGLSYLSGSYSGFGAGFHSAIGFLTPATQSIFFSPNMTPDFTIVEYRRQTAEQAEQIWRSEIDTLTRYASQPILHWPWHDYGPTESVRPYGGYTVDMYSRTLQYAHQKGAEFVLAADAAQRIRTLAASSLFVTPQNGLTARVVGSDLGAFSLLVDRTLTSNQIIRSVDNWYAYDTNRVFLPNGGGTFNIRLGTVQDDVTRISALPMRSKLIGLAGDGTSLNFAFAGQGQVQVTVKSTAGIPYRIQGPDTVYRTGNVLVMNFAADGSHSILVNGAVCGNGTVEMTEQCDDGNPNSGDGCSNSCVIEAGYTCSGQPSVCASLCGNGRFDSGELCDDGNHSSGDGCSNICRVETGYECSGFPSSCRRMCGNGRPDTGELCDDANYTPGDGCSSSCQVEPGFECSGIPSMCRRMCGNGVLNAGEQCDDAGLASGDGCSSSCSVEPGYVCSGQPSICRYVTYTKTFTSIGSEDGRILESAAGSRIGGTVTYSTTAGNALILGDDSYNRSYRSIVSFDTTTLPAGAVIVSAKLQIRRGSTAGTDAFAAFGQAQVDMKKGFFGTKAGLEKADFQAAADYAGAAAFASQGGNGTTYSIPLNSGALAFLNRTGRTQLRLRFNTATNSNRRSDYVGFYPGNVSTAAYRASLVVTYR